MVGGTNPGARTRALALGLTNRPVSGKKAHDTDPSEGFREKRTEERAEIVNYLAHAYRVLDDPYRVAGVSLPDWLAARTRRWRLDPDRLAQAGSGRSEAQASFLAGMRQHLEEDLRFHTAPEFDALCRELAADLRRTVSTDPRFRASFWAHLLVELLLDAHLMAERPDIVDRFYAALARVDVGTIADWTGPLLVGSGARPDLAPWIERFVELRFIADYRSDAGVHRRLDQVGQRIRLPSLPDSFEAAVARARLRVAALAPTLLAIAEGR